MIVTALANYQSSFAYDPAAFMAIKLSSSLLADESLAQFVANELHEAVVPAERACFELSADALAADLSHARRLGASLRDEGCGLALAGLGTSVSWLQLLKEVPFDLLKMRGTLVRSAGADSVDWALLETVNGLAHRVGSQTVAECVENEDILERVRKAGVDYVQGFALGAPRAIEVFQELPAAAAG